MFDGGNVVFVRSGDTVAKGCLRSPAELRHARNVEQLARRAVGLAGVEDDVSLEPDHIHHRFGKLADGDVLSGADIVDAVA